MSTLENILRYCATPKTTKDIAEYLCLEKQSIYTHLNRLQRNGKIEKLGDGRRRAAPATFVVVRQAPTVTESTDDYENLAITHAHAPFGLRL
jgi:predicted ArsR family transcriptional regulator